MVTALIGISLAVVLFLTWLWSRHKANTSLPRGAYSVPNISTQKLIRNIKAIRGPIGPTGPQGDIGPTGLQGDIGPNGLRIEYNGPTRLFSDKFLIDDAYASYASSISSVISPMPPLSEDEPINPRPKPKTPKIIINAKLGDRKLDI